MHLTPAMQDFILHWAEMGARWGTNRSVAQIQALLHLSPTPPPADEIAETLNMARSNVSTGIKELQSWKLVTVERRLGERRLGERRLGERREREYAPTLVALQRVADEAETDQTPTDVKDRIAVTLKTMGLFDKA
jgi:DNA-binding transcriptional regulator GbsR (MarR family)